ncbi:MAG: tRNA (adenosine(37)-N6)-dimethylallyltransferase MiaA [Bacteroidetes bacterium]|nr:tRNA (adenosine(37)-N6)-dimethylallyltransferase MiaA [Bacteroidota bacterium]
MNNELPKIIAVVGTNASGKSAIGIELAKTFNGEIISADSRQVYKGFDLCCGKVTPEEARIVPHHLLDIRDIGEDFSAFDFQQMTYSLISQILQRGKIPFIVGGTGEYVRSVVDGFTFSERPPDLPLRGKLEKLSVEELQAMLTPEAKAFFASRPSEFKNKRRLERAIEKAAHGEPLSYENVAKYKVLQLGVTWPKEILYKRIDERLESRISQGMIYEVKEYLDNGGNPEFLDDLGLEYRYILWHLTGKLQSIDDFKLKMARAIKRFAKKQMTWFKKDNTVLWIDMNSDYLAQAKALITEFLAH